MLIDQSVPKIGAFLLFLFSMPLIINAQPYSIGHSSITFVDASRDNRSIATEIYYPADQDGDDVPINSACFPIISFGHGFLMTSGAYGNIRAALVPAGYIMVFVDTETGLSVSHPDYGLDLAFVVEEMLNLNVTSGDLFENSICGKNVVMGHSMGGGAGVLALENSNNINGYIGLAPAETMPSAIGASANSTIPSLIFSGTSDGVTPPADHHIPIYDGFNSTCKTIVNITGGAHCFYANADLLCDLGEGAASTGITISRAEQQAIMNDYVLPWLDYLNVTEDFGAVESLLTTDERITFQSSCFITSTFDQNIKDVTIFPNPTPDIITIDQIPNELLGENYKVLDILGNEVLKGIIRNTEFVIDMNTTNSGVYFLWIDEVSVSRRIVKM